VLVCINQLVPVRCLELWSVHVSSTKEEPKKEYFQLGIVAQIAEMEMVKCRNSHMAKARLVAVAGGGHHRTNRGLLKALLTAPSRGGVPGAQSRFPDWGWSCFGPLSTSTFKGGAEMRC
jgi:hypothetical protein